MAGKGGGAWKVAYADFVTAMMAFFMVMWIVAQNKPVKEAVATYFKDPSGKGLLPGNSNSALPLSPGGPSPLERNPIAPKAPRNAPLDPKAQSGKVRKPPRQPLLTVESDDGSNIGIQVMFTDESADLDPQARRTLDEVIPNIVGKFNRVEIRGHSTGKRLAPDAAYKNPWELSYARSFATMKYLIEKGVDPRRMRLSQSAGNDPQIADVPGGRVRNSRVEVFILPEVITDPSDSDERRARRQGIRPGQNAGTKNKSPAAETLN